jgi:hypothetical protein
MNLPLALVKAMLAHMHENLSRSRAIRILKDAGARNRLVMGKLPSDVAIRCPCVPVGKKKLMSGEIKVSIAAI